MLKRLITRDDKKEQLCKRTIWTNPVDDPEPYQHFFSALQKAMFLAAHEVD